MEFNNIHGVKYSLKNVPVKTEVVYLKEKIFYWHTLHKLAPDCGFIVNRSVRTVTSAIKMYFFRITPINPSYFHKA